MELKQYQERVLGQVKTYIQTLSALRHKYEEQQQRDPDLIFDYVGQAWRRVVNTRYYPRQTGDGKELPNFCLKVPTGGGKTLLATYTVDLIHQYYLNRKTGLVLWVVPTTQIYRQTLGALKDREHPYRQVLDISSGGRTKVITRFDRFTPQDVQEQLVIMVLMLPAANRRNKETLKMFQDSSGFDAFFPPEDQPSVHAEWVEQIPNLDVYKNDNGFFGVQIKASLGNVLRLVRPVVIIDEGQKAYSRGARDTINGFNPSVMVELSATPRRGLSNVLISVSGQDLNQEEMIKLDLHLINKASTNWKDTLRDSVNQRNALEENAKGHQARTGSYIRPICLIQVERTGRDQRGKGWIHAEDVRETLIQEYGIPPDQVAVKSSDRDDIEGIDLMAEGCPIRYIITKQALQEGWDCPFAYILTVLTNSTAEMALTQLVGRVLRQPYARKTGKLALDESYVYCFRQETKTVLQLIQRGLQDEGLGDLFGRVLPDDDGSAASRRAPVTLRYRERFRPFEGRIFLPRFVTQQNGVWREINYEMDLISRIDWRQVDLSPVKELNLSNLQPQGHRGVVGIDEEGIYAKASVDREAVAGLQLDYVFMTRQLLGVVPNPWIAYEMAQEVIIALQRRYEEPILTANLVFIVEELVKRVKEEKDRLAELIFRHLVEERSILFLMEAHTAYRLPSRIQIKQSFHPLLNELGTSLSASLFDRVPQEGMNELETSVALYLDRQEQLLWWYRNLVKGDYYYVQGWRKNRIFPDFILSKKSPENPEDYDSIYVVETKGNHLDNPDTHYKQRVFELCNELGRRMSWNELGLEIGDKTIEFQVIFEDEWENCIHRIMNTPSRVHADS